MKTYTYVHSHLPSCQVVVTPHVYPPSITMATFLGTALWEQCRASFGYLQTTGYCTSEGCTKFPVLIGEVGSAFETSTDKQWLQDFADFLNAEVRPELVMLYHPVMRAVFVHAAAQPLVAAAPDLSQSINQLIIEPTKRENT